jgi:L-malate glycosyltransferase
MTPSRKKVLIVASWYPRPASPVSGIFVQDQAHALSGEFDVAVISIVPIGVVLSELPHRRHRSANGEKVSARVRRRTAVVPAPVFAGSYYSRACVHAVERSFRQLAESWGTPDIIHAHVTIPGGWAAVHLGDRYGIPVVVTEHSSQFSMHLKTQVDRLCARHTLIRADRVLAVSPMLADRIREFEPQTALGVLGNLIKTDFFVPDPSVQQCDRTRFLSVALLKKQKGIEYLLTAARLLRDRGVDFELVVGGDGPERPQLERLCEILGLADRCTFTGLLNPEGVRALMQASDAFVMPSMYESFGIVLGEAMACGKPVVATRCGGPEYVVTPETGYLVERADPEALAHAMQRMVESRTFDANRVRASIVSRFGPKTFVRRISAVYEDVLG